MELEGDEAKIFGDKVKLFLEEKMRDLLRKEFFFA